MLLQRIKMLLGKKSVSVYSNYRKIIIPSHFALHTTVVRNVELDDYWSSVVNSLYETETVRATNIFRVGEILLFSK